jgi:hypothetical protein
MRPKEKLVPGGILESVTGKTFLFFTGSNKTSDFLLTDFSSGGIGERRTFPA